MKRYRIVLNSASAIVLAMCAATGQVAIAGESTTQAAGDTAKQAEAHDALFALFAEFDERSLKLNPISALFRGDMRYADKIGDYMTDEYTEASREDAELNLTQLGEIDRAALSATDQLAYDVFKYNQEETLKGLTPEIVAATEVRPVNHFSGFHTFYPSFASGQSAAPFKTVEDYENNLKRHANYVELTDRAIERFREGMESGVLETQLTIGNVISQLDTQLEMKLETRPSGCLLPISRKIFRKLTRRG